MHRKWKIYTTLLFILFQLIISGCSNKSKNNYVAIIDGDKVSIEEFRFYLYDVQNYYESIGGKDIWETPFEGMTAEETAKETALNSISHVKISAKQAKAMNITLTKEEKIKVNTETLNTLNALDTKTIENIGIDETQLTKIMEETLLRNKVYEQITDNFELNENDFKNYYEALMNSEKDTLTNSTTPEEKSIQEYQEYYISSRKDQIFEQEYKKWADKIKIEINTEIWDTIKINTEKT